MHTVAQYRAYIAAALIAMIMVVAFVSITEGAIHSATWDADCAALARGESVATDGGSQADFIKNCP